jgi:hypothetical protein
MRKVVKKEGSSHQYSTMLDWNHRHKKRQEEYNQKIK